MKHTTIIRRSIVRLILLPGAVFFLLVIIATPTWAAIQPSFWLDHSVWKATHIVLATEGDVIDGRLKVLESWKGDLEPDTEIVVPELAEFADAQLRRVEWWGRRDLPEPYVRVVSGSTVVLFLVESEPNHQITTSGSDSRVWLPARNSTHGFRVSVVWLERGEAYAYEQLINPGPSVLNHFKTGIELKVEVISYALIQAQLDQALDDRNPVMAAQALRAFRDHKYYYGMKNSIELLGRMGEVAVPTLRALLKDRTFTHWHRDLIPALVEAGGADVISDLSNMVKEGHAFWEKRLPTLEEGWWNSTPANERSELHNQYGRLLAALRALQPLGHEPCRSEVTAVRDLWKADDTLSGVGDNQIVQACNAVLENLPGEPTKH